MLFSEFHINNDLKEALADIGLSDYKQLVAFDGGQIVSRPSKNPVRRIRLAVNGQCKTYFLKQSPESPTIKKIIRSIFGLRMPHTTAFGEKLAVFYYIRLGIPVMEPVGWGEKRILGCPLSGFLLVEEIIGKNFETEFINATYRTRKRLAYGYGSLIGYMHKNDVYDIVRCEEVFCVSDDVANFRNLVTIDRERGRKSKKRFGESEYTKLIKKAKSLAITFLGDARSKKLPMPSRFELLAFIAGYFAENREPIEKRSVLLNLTRKTLNKNYDDREMFQEKYNMIKRLLASF
jgi:hypothetical protein